MRLAGPRSRLTYANVTSTLALVVALGGAGAYAAGKIGASDIKDNAIRSRHIKKGQVKGSDVKESSLKGVDAAKLGGLAPSTFVAGAGGAPGGSTGISRKLITQGSSTPVTLADVPGVGKVELVCNQDLASFEATKDTGVSAVGTVIGVAIDEDPSANNTFNDVEDATLTAAHPTRGTPTVVPGAIGQFTVQMFYGSSTPTQHVATFVTSVEDEPPSHQGKCLAVTQYWANAVNTGSGP